jgi:hypothetical protein
MCTISLSGTETNLMNFWRDFASSYKSIKTARGEKLLLGYFEKLEDLESAKKRTFQLHNTDFRWTRYTPPRPVLLTKRTEILRTSLSKTIAQQVDHVILNERTIQKNRRRVPTVNKTYLRGSCKGGSMYFSFFFY